MRENQTSLTALPRRLTSKRPFEGILPFSFNNVLITDPPSLVGQFKERSNEVSYTSGAHSPFGSVPNNYRYVRSSRLIVNHRRRRHTFQRKPPSANFYIPLYPPFPESSTKFPAYRIYRVLPRPNAYQRGSINRSSETSSVRTPTGEKSYYSHDE